MVQSVTASPVSVSASKLGRLQKEAGRLEDVGLVGANPEDLRGDVKGGRYVSGQRVQRARRRRSRASDVGFGDGAVVAVDETRAQRRRRGRRSEPPTGTGRSARSRGWCAAAELLDERAERGERRRSPARSRPAPPIRRAACCVGYGRRTSRSIAPAVSYAVARAPDVPTSMDTSASVRCAVVATPGYPRTSCCALTLSPSSVISAPFSAPVE